MFEVLVHGRHGPSPKPKISRTVHTSEPCQATFSSADSARLRMLCLNLFSATSLGDAMGLWSIQMCLSRIGKAVSFTAHGHLWGPSHRSRSSHRSRTARYHWFAYASRGIYLLTPKTRPTLNMKMSCMIASTDPDCGSKTTMPMLIHTWLGKC